MIRLFLLPIFLVFVSWSGYGQRIKEQQQVAQYKLEHQVILQQQLSATLDSAVYLVEQGKHSEANRLFKYLLEKKREIPSTMVYYFGINSFYMRKYSQSLDWLNKYIQLKGVRGRFSENVVNWIAKAEEALKEQQKKENVKIITHLHNNRYVECSITGKLTCPVCRGYMVVIKEKYGEKHYKTCSYCDSQGYISCYKYNQTITKYMNFNQETMTN